MIDIIQNQVNNKNMLVDYFKNMVKGKLSNFINDYKSDLDYFYSQVFKYIQIIPVTKN